MSSIKVCLVVIVFISGSEAKACPIARGKFDIKKHGFGQVHGLI